MPCTAAGLEIDTQELERILGVPVVEVVAIKKQGFDELESRLKEHARVIPTLLCKRNFSRLSACSNPPPILPPML
jgi:Fe2+ transport system protein B